MYTVSPGLQPDVAPVSFELDGEHFYVGGLNLAATLKHNRTYAKGVLIPSPSGRGLG
jgi:hypothetical protein